MEPLRLKPRLPAEPAPEIENWDDDDFFADDGDDFAFRSSINSNPTTDRRDSMSSRRSMRSELESLHEEERQIHVPGDDENSTMNAITVAANLGIPIPKNVPPSALMGGTIKRLGGRKIKKIIDDDWDADLELPEGGKPLAIKPQDGSRFPDAIRQVSGGSVQLSPTGSRKQASPVIHQHNFDLGQPRSSPTGASINLDRFRDDDDDDDFFGDGSATIKVSKSRGLGKPISLLTPPTPQKGNGILPPTDDDFEQDLELPSDGKLKLSTTKDIPKTPALSLDDLDWGEGSLGTRYGGTRRDGRSNRSSSASALSPSISSSITAESEDETFDGLVLPAGPVNFEQRLKLRRKSRSPERIPEDEPAPQPKKLPEAEEEDFLTGLDLGESAVPRHQRAFGDGNELDGFDDLPVSRDTEARFVKQPVAKDVRPPLRNKIYQNVLPDRSSAASPVSPYSPVRPDYTPSFARDTAASRIAREASLAQRAPAQGPLAPLTAQRVAQLSTRSNLSPNLPQSPVRSRKHSKKQPQLKPHLISNLNSTRDVKALNGMTYNPATFKWEGNENVLGAFDPPASSPSTTSLPPYMLRERENSTPRPALIANVGSTKGVQVVGEMVFDPQNMCWLKLGASAKPVSETGDPLDGFNGLEDDDEDVFKDIPDLEEKTTASNDGGAGRVSDIRDDWLVGEEFDVGPEFIRRQREEEERWRKKASVATECVSTYNDLKLSKKYKFIIFKLSDDNREIVVEEASDNADWEVFREKLINATTKTRSGAVGKGPRYAVYDFEYTLATGEGVRNKITFIAWSPDDAGVQSKMIYASSKESLKRSLTGLAVELQANDSDDIEYDTVLKTVSKGLA
ncbi:related to cytokinesis inhibitor byr4 [Cephalotrichum gorgonifer]|uniref:Cofilin n=1 Tax=Cephalotrichum gorgonifer TaxID=2041049 RepID=A0AAE8SYC7_9PEZI|nr:related to cytokinesis inhibitor byr4 [Cephalotrichum gorgonifer]